ncbi:MAG: hypothetical protein J6L69_10275 [Lachnospiraceae bacterium]|nr:hypothetical protein [Lachnospiraceae bacterium]
MNVSDEIKELYKKTNDSTISKNYVIGIDGTDYDNKNIVFGSFSLTEKLCSNTQLRFGECNASMLKLKMVAEIGDISDKKINLKQIINENSVDIGVYNVDSCLLTENKKYRDIVAYDNIILFNTNVSEWYEMLEFPTTMNAMLQSLCDYIGVELAEVTLVNGEVELEKTISPEDIKGITVLKSIAELNGGFFRAAADGKIEFITLDTNVVNEYLEVKHYKTLKTENYTVNKFTRVNVRTEDGDIGGSAGEGDNAYIVQDNFLIYGSSTEKLEVLAANIYEVIKDITYIPYTSEQIGLPYIKCGQQVSYKLTSGESFVGLILQRTLSGTQGLKDVIKSSGTKTTGESFGIAEDVIKLKNKMNRLKRTVEATSLLITNLEENLNNEIIQTDNELKVLIEKVATLGDTGVVGIQVVYALSDSCETAPDDGWNVEAPTWIDGMYMWQKTITTYGDETTVESVPICLPGRNGKDGEDGANGKDGKDGEDGSNGSDGKGITSIVDYYLASSSASGVTTATNGWTTSLQTTTTTKKYLWNYEKITYTDGTTSNTSVRIIGTHGETGAKGETGATGATGAAGKDGSNGSDGKGIVSMVDYYLASSSASGVTTSTSGWTTSLQTTTTTKKYLWNYEKITYTDGTTSNTSVRIIGTHGETGAKGETGAAGADGLTVSSIVPQYYVSTSKTALAGGSWSSAAPTWSKDKYVWTRSVITYSDGTKTYTTAVCDASWEVANSIQAELSLKVDKETLISEINAAADVIKILSNRLIIQSTNFQMDEKGNVTLKEGSFTGSKFISSIDEDVNMVLGESTSESSGNVQSVLYKIEGLKVGSKPFEEDDSVYVGGVEKTTSWYGGQSTSEEKRSGLFSPNHGLSILTNGDIEIVNLQEETLSSGYRSRMLLSELDSLTEGIEAINSNLKTSLKVLGVHTVAMNFSSTASLGRAAKTTVSLGKSYSTASFFIITHSANSDWVVVHPVGWNDTNKSTIIINYQNYYGSTLSGNVNVIVVGT